MIDLITYVEDINLFKEEGERIGGDLFTVDDGNISFNTVKIPVHYNGNESVCLVRVASAEVISGIDSLKIIGECVGGEYVFYSERDRETYERIYNTEAVIFEGEDGEQVEYTPPYMMGVFA